MNYPIDRRQALITIATILIVDAAHSAPLNGLKALESFIRDTQSGRAAFTQVVTPPAKDGQATRRRTSSGTFEFQRPGRFRFVYQKPFEQTIVADGQTLWMHDADLNQVTRRPQAQALDNTPAALVATSTSLQALEKDFALEEEPVKDMLIWVLAKPKTQGGLLQSVRVGLRPAAHGGAELAVLEMTDSFGQHSVLRFTGFETNPNLPASVFQFKPPAGADVLQQ